MLHDSLIDLTNRESKKTIMVDYRLFLNHFGESRIANPKANQLANYVSLVTIHYSNAINGSHLGGLEGSNVRNLTFVSDNKEVVFRLILSSKQKGKYKLNCDL